MQAVIEVNPKKLGGVPCFAGTRVPAAYLFIHMAHGGTVDSFVEDYDSVSRDLAVSFAQALGDTLNEPKAVGNEKRLFGVADGMARALQGGQEAFSTPTRTSRFLQGDRALPAASGATRRSGRPPQSAL